MVKDILIETDHGRCRLAALEDGELRELYVERDGREKLVGSIFKGRVTNILPGMQAAFVNIGLEKNAFLFAGDIQVDRADLESPAMQEQLKNLSIKRMLRAGQELLVQVVKDPGGTKGPRITSHITLPGRLCVLLPTVQYVGVSHRIEDEPERARLRSAAEALRPPEMGLIVRTAALGADAEELERDLNTLLRLWDSLKTRAEHIQAPARLHHDENLAYRSVRDMLSEIVRAIYLDDPAQFEEAKTAAQTLSPELADRVAYYEGAQPLFDMFDADKQIEKALSRKVWLKSGGYIVIDPTEALTVIDVNTGKFVGTKSLSETVFAINCEAVCEIARQLRLRDLGGIIVIDFIDMDLQEQKDQLVQLLRQELKRDSSKTNVVGLTGLGLVEMTRKKVHQPIHTLLKRPCPLCQGSGSIVSEETVAFEALKELKKSVRLTNSPCWLITTSQAVAGQLLLLGGLPGQSVYVNVARRDEPFVIEPISLAGVPEQARKLR